VRDAHAHLKELETREAELTTRQEDVRRKADYLRHVLQEIERAKPKLGEDDALEIESKRLAHAEELARLARELEETVDAAGLTKAQKILASLLRVDSSLGKWQELLDAAFSSAAELAQVARAYASEIEADPERLSAVEQRRDLLFRLQQKHGPTIADVLAARDTAARELELLDTADLDLRNIAADRAKAAEEFSRATAALTAKRIAGAKKLSRAVNKILPALGMPGGRFLVSQSPVPSPRADGAETVTFEVELNPGLGQRPLARVASGGELSRLMLALKVVLASHDVVPTLVFDEVDQGIGGEVGGRVGEALMDVSREGRQARHPHQRGLPRPDRYRRVPALVRRHVAGAVARRGGRGRALAGHLARRQHRTLRRARPAPDRAAVPRHPAHPAEPYRRLGEET